MELFGLMRLAVLELNRVYLSAIVSWIAMIVVILRMWQSGVMEQQVIYCTVVDTKYMYNIILIIHYIIILERYSVEQLYKPCIID